MWLERACALFAALLAIPSQSTFAQATAPGIPDVTGNVAASCEAEARNGGGAQGCFWNSSIDLGPMPGQLYWHVDRFPDTASAEEARSIYGKVILALGGQVFLQTVTDNSGWRPESGEHVATIGPLIVPSGVDLIASFMEATISGSSHASLRRWSGPTAIVLLDGSLCVETPAGTIDVEAGESIILPTQAPMQFSTIGNAEGQALLLAVFPASKPGFAGEMDWKPSGLCHSRN